MDKSLSTYKPEYKDAAISPIPSVRSTKKHIKSKRIRNDFGKDPLSEVNTRAVLPETVEYVHHQLPSFENDNDPRYFAPLNEYGFVGSSNIQYPITGQMSSINNKFCHDENGIFNNCKKTVSEYLEQNYINNYNHSAQEQPIDYYQKSNDDLSNMSWTNNNNNNGSKSIRYRSSSSKAQHRQTKPYSLSPQQMLPSLLPPMNTSSKIKDVNKIDRYSRIIFPVSYMIFNLFYWSFYNIQ